MIKWYLSKSLKSPWMTAGTCFIGFTSVICETKYQNPQKNTKSAENHDIFIYKNKRQIGVMNQPANSGVRCWPLPISTVTSSNSALLALEKQHKHNKERMCVTVKNKGNLTCRR